MAFGSIVPPVTRQQDFNTKDPDFGSGGVVDLDPSDLSGGASPGGGLEQLDLSDIPLSQPLGAGGRAGDQGGERQPIDPGGEAIPVPPGQGPGTGGLRNLFARAMTLARGAPRATSLLGDLRGLLAPGSQLLAPGAITPGQRQQGADILSRLRGISNRTGVGGGVLGQLQNRLRNRFVPQAARAPTLRSRFGAARQAAQGNQAASRLLGRLRSIIAPEGQIPFALSGQQEGQTRDILGELSAIAPNSDPLAQLRRALAARFQ